MTKLNISISMPYLLEGTYCPEWAKTAQDNEKHLETLTAANPKQIASYKTRGSAKSFSIMCTRFKNMDVYYVEANGHIQYCVEVESFHTTGLATLHTLSQTSVWRNKSFRGLPTLAEWIFNTILMPINGNIMSDEQQSEDGRNFWEKRINIALDRKHVYALWLYGTETLDVLQVISIKSLDDIDQYYTQGNDTSGKYWRFLISDTIIKIKE